MDKRIETNKTNVRWVMGVGAVLITGVRFNRQTI